MKFYRLQIASGETCEGEDADEWFTSLRAAKKRRTELIQEGRVESNEHPFGSDYEIWRYTVNTRLTAKTVMLRILNRNNNHTASPWCSDIVQVVDAYRPHREPYR